MVRDEVREIQKVIVFRALKLGDLLVAVPALRAIRAGLPAARIALVGLPWARLMLERFPQYLDDFIEFPGYPGLPELSPDLHRLPGFLAEVQREHFHLAIQMHGAGTITNPLVACFDAALTGGYYLPGAYCPDPDLFLIYPHHRREVDRCADLVRHLGFRVDDDRLEFPVYPRDMEALAGLADRCSLPAGELVVMHAGASVPQRRWRADQFARLADRLIEAGYPVVLTGTAEEQPVVAEVIRGMRHGAINLCGQTDLGVLAALLTASRLLICNDTGVSHLADALRVPSVVLFSDSNSSRWAPADGRLHIAVENSASLNADSVFPLVERALAVNPRQNHLHFEES
jgi:ADP-heptose:LPS heptosyltransferase